MEPGDERIPALALAAEAVGRGDVEAAVVHLSEAVRTLTAAGDNRGAALASARLGELFQTMMGNKVAARPWFNRAMRLVQDEEPCLEQGWVALAPLGCDVEDPEVLAARAELALDRARRFGDVDLEVKALADGGLAQVQLGRVAEGMAMLDEAMALACGGVATDEEAVGKSVCSFYTACYHTADVQRVGSWSEIFRRRGLVGPGAGTQAFLSSHCDSVRATLLCQLGRWNEAEEVLVQAYDAIEALMPGVAWHPPLALAELRILQGRLAEAEALLLGRDDNLAALVPMARLHLARGDWDLARAAARRGLRLVGADRVRGAALLGVLVEAELGGGDLQRAAEALSDLQGRTDGLAVAALKAEAARLTARVRAAEGDRDAALEALHVGLSETANGDLPLTMLAIHCDLARLHEAAGDRAAAVVEARAAASLLARLDVILAPADAALLDRLGLGASSSPPETACRVATLRRDSGSWWTAQCGGTEVRLRNTKGLCYLSELVSRPGSERHVLDLVDMVEGGPDPATGLDRRRLGDAGPLIDAGARSAYRRRLAELRDEVEDALAVEDDERAARVQAELDALVGELARAVGLGGRDRRAASAAEKARLNVTRALRTAISAVVDGLPEAGAVLDRRVRTGVFCAYDPHPDDGLVWTVAG